MTYSLPSGQNPTTPVGLAAPVRPRKIRESKSEFIVIIFVAIGSQCPHSYVSSGVRDSEEPDASSEVDPLAGVRKTPRGPILRSRLQGRSTGMMVDPLSIAIPAAEDQVAPEALAGSIGDRPQRTRKFDLSAHRAQRQVFKSVVSASLSSSVPGIPSQGRVSGEGTSRMIPAQAALEVEGKSTLAFSYDKEVPILEDPERIVSIWRKLRPRNCELLR